MGENQGYAVSARDEVLARIRDAIGDTPDRKLSLAQRVVAREYGFHTWAQLRSHVQETDRSALVPSGPWHYYTRTVEGLQYAIHCRRADPARTLDPRAVLAAAGSDD